jgi:hypothetical protein
MSYIIMRGCWCHIIVLNVHAPTEDKTDDVKDSFYEELEHVFDKFLKYHMKILLGDFNAKVDREDIFKPTIWNESFHEISNDNGVMLVNFAISRSLRVKSTMFPHRNIHNIFGRLQMGKLTIRLTIFWWIGERIRMYLMFDHSGQQIVIVRVKNNFVLRSQTGL